MRRFATVAALTALLSSCAPLLTPPVRPPAAPRTICHECFWKYQPAALEQELIAVYGGRSYGDRLDDAQRRMLLARVRDDERAYCAARGALAGVWGSKEAREPARALVVAETLAFTADECGSDPARAFARAAKAARRAGEGWKGSVYAGLAAGTFAPRFGDAPFRTNLAVPAGTKSFVLGASKVVLPPGARVGAQVERTVRDWLSYQLQWDERDRPVPKDSLLTWHEGARLRDLLDAAPEKILPLTGALAARQGDRWLAADEDGVFRFEVLEDKVQYPTTLEYDGVALLRDTHGISALVEPAVRERAGLVVGCGDAVPKMEAAVWLARRGVNVWFPCDRFVGDVLGYEGPGVLLGSAPVRAEGGSAVIGDRPVAFRVDETIVVEDSTGRGPLRYYDAPARYFRALGAALPSLKLDFVDVDDAGQSDRIVRRAEEIGASAIAVRVQTDEDAAPVRAWLAASREHRAVLFHTAPYPAGYALFGDFPGQTTFGDPRPEWR
jgi:hypothetical protein